MSDEWGLRASELSVLGVLTRRLGGHLTDGEAVAWAVSLLGSGIDTPALRELAGADIPRAPAPGVVDSLVPRAAQELGVNTAGVHLRYLQELAGRIGSASDHDVRRFVDEIYREVLTPLDFPKFLKDWLAVYVELDSEGASTGDGVAWARELARRVA